MESSFQLPSFKTTAGELIAKEKPSTLQLNITKKCNLACKHCHVNAGPSCKEDMDLETAKSAIKMLKEGPFSVLDLTGGAPEMSGVFKFLVDEAYKLGKKILVRSNLTIHLEEGYEDYLEFMRDRKVEVISSLPFYEKKKTDSQRGVGVYDASIEVLKRLNKLGYGREADLILDLVYNPGGAFLPASQESIELRYRTILLDHYDIVFNNLFTITNMPIGRYKSWLLRSRNYDRYMNKLHSAFNPQTVCSVMCLDMISVDYKGDVYDCDFNLALDLPLKNRPNINNDTINYERKIITGPHCYGCTAGSGSS